MTHGGLRCGHKNSQKEWTMEEIHVTACTSTERTGTTFSSFLSVCLQEQAKPDRSTVGEAHCQEHREPGKDFSDTTVKLTTASLTHPPPCFLISPKASPLVWPLEMQTSHLWITAIAQEEEKKEQSHHMDSYGPRAHLFPKVNTSSATACPCTYNTHFI